MKTFGLYLIASALLTSSAWAFTDTAAFFSSQALDKEFEYITDASTLTNTIKDMTEEFCNGSNDKITIYRVQNLLNDYKPEIGSYIKHVRYNSANELDFLGTSCATKAKYFTEAAEGDSQVSVIDIEDDKKHTIDEFLGGEGKIIVQGKPSFHKPGSQIEAIKSYVEDTVYDNLHIDMDLDNILNKRGDDFVSDAEMEEIIADIELDMNEVDSFINDDRNALDIDIEDVDVEEVYSSDASTTSKKNSNLFTKYQFFTPGLWSCLLVSGFLIFVLSIALRWISSLEISYNSFDKQIDFEKKNE